MRFYIIGECPACVGSGDLLALLSKKDESLFCYCPACGLAWNEIPSQVDEMNSLDDLAPDGVIPAGKDDLISRGINNFDVTEVYKDIDDIK